MVLQFIVSTGLIIIVAAQSSKGEGLGAIGGSSQLFSVKNRGFEALMDRLTTILAVSFLVLSVLITIVE